MLKGYDVSKWQSVGSVDFSNVNFVIIKATEGVGYTDPLCDKHYQQAKAQGKLLGVYHFARPGYNDAVAEADWFVSQIQGYIKEAILVLDWEVEAVWNTAWAKTWLDRVYAKTGVKPLIYMSASVVNGYDWKKVVDADYGLWVAGYPPKYNVKNPPMPSPEDMPYSIGAWPFWAIWQYSSGAGSLDYDIASMDADAWFRYAGQTSEPQPQPTPEPTPKKSNEEIADEVIRGLWGNGEERKQRLAEAGYDWGEVQAIVDERMREKEPNFVFYVVKPGDTLSGIAKAFNTNYMQIAKDSGISDPNVIYPGQVLKIRR